MREDVRSIANICPSCFGTLDRNGICRTCGMRPENIANPPPALSLRSVIGSRYLTGKTLGIGGFGITYLGWDLNESRKVAIKEFFPKEFATRERGESDVNVLQPENVYSFNHWLRAFVEEAKLLMRIKHLHGVVKLLDYFDYNNTAYIVTDYLEGKSLRALLTEQNYKIPYDEALGILRPVLQSLAVLHGYGVIHKDISPENIIIVLEKYVKLIDFGAAALYKVSSDEQPFIVQKSGYSPIELYRAGEPHGPWTDVYQIGATIYNSITGYIPSVATEREKEDKLPLPSKLEPSVPDYVDKAVMKAMAVKPQDRYQSIGELIKDLQI